MIQINTWRKSPTARGGASFYPTTKFFAVVLDEKGAYLGETGKCATRAAAAAAGERLATKLVG